jgi:hypothetical protein
LAKIAKTIYLNINSSSPPPDLRMKMEWILYEVHDMSARTYGGNFLDLHISRNTSPNTTTYMPAKMY